MLPHCVIIFQSTLKTTFTRIQSEQDWRNFLYRQSLVPLNSTTATNVVCVFSSLKSSFTNNKHFSFSKPTGKFAYVALNCVSNFYASLVSSFAPRVKGSRFVASRATRNAHITGGRRCGLVSIRLNGCC